jgi:hypothetical protein
MSELAYDLNGEPIALPASAHWWRVRRFRNPGMRGAPEVVTDRDGAPLVLPIDAVFTDFREEVDGAAGRYRLDPLDERRKVVPDVPAAYVTLSETARTTAVAAHDDRDAVIRELVRAQADMVKTMSERFAGVMHAAADLLRAADGAGLPARPPMAVVEAGDDEEEASQPALAPAAAAPAPGGFDLNTLVAQVVPMVVMKLMDGKLAMPKLSEILDWRKAVPKPAATGEPRRAPETTVDVAHPMDTTRDGALPAADGASDDDATLPPLDPSAMAHFLAIQSALAPREAALAREVAKDLTPAQLRSWFAELSALSVPDAVAKIRGLLVGGASGSPPGGSDGRAKEGTS